MKNTRRNVHKIKLMRRRVAQFATWSLWPLASCRVTSCAMLVSAPTTASTAPSLSQRTVAGTYTHAHILETNLMFVSTVENVSYTPQVWSDTSGTTPVKDRIPAPIAHRHSQTVGPWCPICGLTQDPNHSSARSVVVVTHSAALWSFTCSRIMFWTCWLPKTRRLVTSQTSRRWLYMLRKVSMNRAKLELLLDIFSFHQGMLHAIANLASPNSRFYTWLFVQNSNSWNI